LPLDHTGKLFQTPGISKSTSNSPVLESKTNFGTHSTTEALELKLISELRDNSKLNKSSSSVNGNGNHEPAQTENSPVSSELNLNKSNSVYSFFTF
jgi:hypothetical protein